MIKERLFRFLFGTGAVLLVGVLVIVAQRENLQIPQTNTLAKLFVQKAFAARDAGDYTTAFSEYRKAIDADPDNVELNRAFVRMIKAGINQASMDVFMAKQPPANLSAEELAKFKQTSPAEIAAAEKRLKERQNLLEQVRKFYEAQVMRYPNKAVYTYSLATALSWPAGLRMDELLRKTIELDPTIVDAYVQLAQVKTWLNDEQGAADALKKAVELRPKDEQLRSQYAERLYEVDPVAARKIYEDTIAKNSGTEAAASALVALIAKTEDPKEKIALGERMMREYPAGRFQATRAVMYSLFDAYLQTDPSKALTLARELAKGERRGRNEYWAPRADYLGNMQQAKSLIAAGKYAEAVVILEKTKVPERIEPKQLTLARAEATGGGGDTAKAYKILVDYFAATPDDEIRPFLMKYAEKLEKTPRQVESDLWAWRMKNAVVLKDLPLNRLDGGQKVKPSDFRGKIVFLYSWYPG